MKKIIIIIGCLFVPIAIVLLLVFNCIIIEKENIPVFEDGTALKMTGSQLIKLKGSPTCSGQYESSGQFWCKYSERISNRECEVTYGFINTLFGKRLHEVLIETDVLSKGDFVKFSNILKTDISHYYKENENLSIDNTGSNTEISVDNGSEGILYTIEYTDKKCLLSIVCDI